MKLFLIALIVSCSFGILAKCIFLSLGQYPREGEIPAWSDVLSLIFGLAWVFWACWLLINLGKT